MGRRNRPRNGTRRILIRNHQSRAGDLAILIKSLASLVLLYLLASAANAQDVSEYAYQVPALAPRHKQEKPKVTGWATRRVEEKLDRGLLALFDGAGKVYLGWRLLKDDPPAAAFNIYRSAGGGEAVRLNPRPISATTDFLDSRPPQERPLLYWIRAVVDGKELEPSERTEPRAPPDGSWYASVRFQGNYAPQKVAVADLDGNGSYDFVIKQPDSSIDPAGPPDTTGLTYKVEAYLADGRFLWRHDLGPGIEPGVWYSPLVAYDFDGDGKAEVALKTGPADARESDGRVRAGPEWCSVLDGMTGRELARADWPPRDPRLGDYNRINRNQLGVAYLDGKTPCLIVARGTYKLMVVDAYEYRDRRLRRLWHWEGDDETPVIRSQGAHFMHSADVDGDGRDEIVLGSAVIDDNGTCLWSAGLGHPDKCYVTDIDPRRPGLEILYAIEPPHQDGNGVCLVEARTGKIIWGIGRPTRHVGDAMVADIDPSSPGLECWAIEDRKGGSADRYLLSADGKILAEGKDVPPCRNWLFWDADLLRETVVRSRLGPAVAKHKGPMLTTGIRGTPMLAADVLGDWREELITVEPGRLFIYTTTIPAADRRPCLMQDPVYRADVAHLSMGYPQPAVTGYYLGEPVATPAPPNGPE